MITDHLQLAYFCRLLALLVWATCLSEALVVLCIPFVCLRKKKVTSAFTPILGISVEKSHRRECKKLFSTVSGHPIYWNTACLYLTLWVFTNVIHSTPWSPFPLPHAEIARLLPFDSTQKIPQESLGKHPLCVSSSVKGSLLFFF